MAPWSLLRSLCTLFFLGIQGPWVPKMMFDILKSCHEKGAGGGVPPITCNNHRPAQGAGAHPKCRSCNALWPQDGGSPQATTLAPLTRSPAQVPLRPLDSSSPGLPLGLSFHLPAPACPTQLPHRPHSLLTSANYCAWSKTWLPSLPPQKPHPPLLTLREGASPEVRVSLRTSQVSQTWQPHWFGPGDLAWQHLTPTTLLGSLFQSPPPPSPVAKLAWHSPGISKNKTCSQQVQPTPFLPRSSPSGSGYNCPALFPLRLFLAPGGGGQASWWSGLPFQDLVRVCMLSGFSRVWHFLILWTVAIRLLCPWNSPGKNAGVGCHALLQRISSTLGSNSRLLCLLHSQVGYLPLVPPEKCQLNLISQFKVAAAAAKSLQSCPTLCDSIDGSPPGSPIPRLSRQGHWSGLPFPSPMHESEKWKWSCSVVSNSSRPHGLQPTRLLCLWDFPGKSTGVGCHCLLSLSPWLKIKGFRPLAVRPLLARKFCHHKCT